jgi:1-acyl-sn-glycerol-3-phosphate acyltransferase
MTTSEKTHVFLPAIRSRWFLWLVQTFQKLTLGFRNQLRIDDRDLDILRNLPVGMGIILTPNHADEVDPRICIELSRLCGRRFIFMGNREAFDEYLGLAGWILQRINVFSVERGGHDVAAKKYAEDVVENGKDVLVIFPEGEIYYLNDSVQPFHSGAIDIGIQAIIDKGEAEWNAYIVPMAIKYKYRKPVREVLEKRVQKMEQRLKQDMSGATLRKRLNHLLSEVVQREAVAHDLQSDTDRLLQLKEKMTFVRHALLEEVEHKYSTDVVRDSKASQARTIDRAWKLESELRGKIKGHAAEQQSELRKDLASLNEVAHMVSWQPDYVDLDPSSERLAEVVKKLEREIFGIKRPRQVAARNVFVRIGEPIDLAKYVAEFRANPHPVRHLLADQLRTTIQTLIDEIIVANAPQRSANSEATESE